MAIKFFVGHIILSNLFLNLSQVFNECSTRHGSGNSFELSLVGYKCISAYVRNKKNQNQVLKLKTLNIIGLLDQSIRGLTMFLFCRSAGHGKRSVHRVIEGSSSS